VKKTNQTEPRDVKAKKDKFLLEIKEKETLSFRDIFRNDNPVFLEIGSGKGEFLSEFPLLHPEWNFIGFEMKLRRVNIILRKLDLELHNNIRLAVCRIDAGIEKIISPNSVTGVFIQHPDPWPKRRHFKRRLLQQDFIDALGKILQKGGFIQISTDHEEYAVWIQKQFSQRLDFIAKPASGIDFSSDKHIVTFYEREQRKLGFEPRFMLYEKL